MSLWKRKEWAAVVAVERRDISSGFSCCLDLRLWVAAEAAAFLEVLGAASFRLPVATMTARLLSDHTEVLFTERQTIVSLRQLGYGRR